MLQSKNINNADVGIGRNGEKSGEKVISSTLKKVTNLQVNTGGICKGYCRNFECDENGERKTCGNPSGCNNSSKNDIDIQFCV